MRRNARITQNQDSASFAARLFINALERSASFLRIATDSGMSISTPTMSLHFKLHQFGWIAAGIARRAKFAFVVFHSLAQAGER